MRSKPYTPIFDMAPVSSIVTGDGASEYAAGSQVWNGISGTFTANPASTPTASHIITGPRCAVPSAPERRSRPSGQVQIHAAGGEEHGEKRQQQSHRSRHGVDEELRRRRPALRPAPQLDQEERRNQAQLPEQKPVKEIQRGERCRTAPPQASAPVRNKVLAGDARDAPRPPTSASQSPRAPASTRQAHPRPGDIRCRAKAPRDALHQPDASVGGYCVQTTRARASVSQGRDHRHAARMFARRTAR